MPDFSITSKISNAEELADLITKETLEEEEILYLSEDNYKEFLMPFLVNDLIDGEMLQYWTGLYDKEKVKQMKIDKAEKKKLKFEKEMKIEKEL